MESTILTLTLRADLVHQQNHLKEVVSLANQQDTDMVIVSKDKKLIPCHTSLLALFSPVVARLLSGVPCCSSPTIFLPDFPALHIRKLLHHLKSGQAIPGENVNVDIRMINRITEVLQISMIDLNLGLYLENPLEIPFEIKKELNSFTVKEEITSFKEEKKVEVLHVKQEMESYNVKLESIPVKQDEIAEQDEYIEEDETEEVLKQEYMGDTGSHQEYYSNSASKAKEEAPKKPEPVADIKRKKPKINLKPKPNICNFFVRGKCTRRFCKCLHEKSSPAPTKKEETSPSNSMEKKKQACYGQNDQEIMQDEDSETNYEEMEIYQQIDSDGNYNTEVDCIEEATEKSENKLSKGSERLTNKKIDAKEVVESVLFRSAQEYECEQRSNSYTPCRNKTLPMRLKRKLSKRKAKHSVFEAATLRSKAASLMSEAAPLKRTRHLGRCNKCTNCKIENCGDCHACLNMKQFGGTGSLKKACITRPACLEKTKKNDTSAKVEDKGDTSTMASKKIFNSDKADKKNDTSAMADKNNDKFVKGGKNNDTSAKEKNKKSDMSLRERRKKSDGSGKAVVVKRVGDDTIPLVEEVQGGVFTQELLSEEEI